MTKQVQKKKKKSTIDKGVSKKVVPKKVVKKNGIGKAKTAETRKGTRRDSTSAKTAIAQAAFREIQPPPHVRLLKRDYPFWDSIVREFAKIEWSDHALEVAAVLARAMSALEKEQFILSKEGSMLPQKTTVKNDDGKEVEKIIGQYINPRLSIIKMQANLVLQYRRSLSLHARGQGGESRDIGARRASAKVFENEILDDDDDLLARPTMN